MKKLSNLYDNIIYDKKSGNIYFIDKKYKLTFPFKYTPCYPKYNERGVLEYYTCIKLKLNGLSVRDLITNILDDFSCVANIEVVTRLLQDIVRYFRKFYRIPLLSINYDLDSKGKKSKSSKTVFALSKIQTKSYKNQLVDLIFNEKPIDFLWCIAEEQREKYKFEVYWLLDCIGNDFHKIEKNYYFDDNGYLELLEYHLRNRVYFNDFDREYIGKYINLRFEGDRLVVKFKRNINDMIWSYGFIDKVLDDFIAIGINELYEIFVYYGINREVFENNITAENYTLFHLAKEIRCNVETEQPELLDRLIDKIGKEKERLSDNLKHCIDYSNGYAEYEIIGSYPNGVSLDKIKEDLILLEKDVRPKYKPFDKYLDINNESYCSKTYKVSKGYLPTSEFSIEPNKYEKNAIPNVENIIYELHDFNISEKELFIHTKQIISKYC